ncbi:starch synthase [Sphingobium sp. 22B]|uniref:glycogen synthase GlgA n=1 Tax=unclassified Sphingobium TaxID=2611147 RepID=UPI0007808AA5|nr:MULTISPECIES: glycogen synthase GlgA [unclassified Sphingobium]KXU32971.1 starch synthase [Sphingobium sp. AM]KYC33151.1 starch synthase [Sphingobium sp. 22B]OAP33192.1 starch synthase [Sphingobium sp. 20006FA]
MAMRVLSVTSEIYPLVKTGGLADVAGALPGALAGHGIGVRTLVPGYPAVLSRLGKAKLLRRYDALFGAPAAVLAAKLGDLDLLVLDAPDFFAREGGPYGDAGGGEWPDNWKRFAALSRAGADMATEGVKGWRPDLVHAHDWQAAMTAAYMRFGPAHAVPRVVTIHNLAFQGRFGADVFPQLGLPLEAWGVDGVEYYGGTGYLKAGLVSADAITTVSPTYADEIRSPMHGMGLDGLINGRSDRLHGILNGVDTAIWDPAADPLIAKPFSARALGGRGASRRVLETQFGLDRDDAPIFIIVSRLTWQKGMDMVMDAIDHLVGLGGKLALLGSGDHPLEGAFLAAADRHRGRVGARIGYDEPLSHLMQAGADAILIPSRFEPCGLTQLYGLRYGCVPVVARVGGLADTVIDANEAAVGAGVATGIVFPPSDPLALHGAIARTIRLHAHRPTWQAMQRAGMRADFSWTHSAARYAELFRALVRTTA